MLFNLEKDYLRPYRAKYPIDNKRTGRRTNDLFSIFFEIITKLF